MRVVSLLAIFVALTPSAPIAQTLSAMGDLGIARVCVNMVDYAVEVGSLSALTNTQVALDKLRDLDLRVASERTLAGIVLGEHSKAKMFGQMKSGDSFVSFVDQCVADENCRRDHLMPEAALFAMQLKAACEADYKGRS